MVGSTVSIYRITEVNSVLDAINGVSVPLGRLFAQMQSDAEILSRELERGLGYTHWKDEHWKPRPIPKWIQDVLKGEVEQAQKLIRSGGEWAPPESKQRWAEWAENINQQFESLKTEADELHDALEKQDEQKALLIYPHWTESMEDWKRQLQWGASEYERQIRQTFALAETRVAELKVGLEMILGAVVLLSLLMLWFGERALRPLAELTKLARSITRRGLRREDKASFPEIPLSRNDEVSQLAREFHRMATALLEREKIVETQTDRLQDQNRLLRDMGALNENVLKSIDSILLVTDLHGRITQCNPVAVKWLGAKDSKEAVGTLLGSWAKLRPALLTRPKEVAETVKISPIKIDHRIYGGHWMPLKHDAGHSGHSDQMEMTGAILVLDDMTDERDLQERLSRAENLAAVGRMSAQVAHEVRNPLHSIGLEAEMAVDLAATHANPALKQSLQSILRGVDRLEKITENYLKLSKLSAGQQGRVDLGDILESVLATYTTVCEAEKVQVDWRREQNASLVVWGDRELLEQVFGNLMSNSLQALESVAQPKVTWRLGNTDSGKVWVRVEDNGPGVSAEILPKLFTPFVTSKAQGTGLGLSFVKKVIEDQGGKIEYLVCEQGACFEMIFPQKEESLSLAPEMSDVPAGMPSAPVDALAEFERGRDLNV
jgi:nitrogen fixation/metabolism regulation signal transduction histidine kinase